MKSMFNLFVCAGAILTSFAANAQLQLGQPSYGGTGCPAGSASVTLSPDSSAISMLFDSYVTEAGNTTGRRVDRKSCNITVPVSVPNGYSVAVFQVDYRGFNLIPRGASNRFDVEYFWAGSQGPRVSRMFTGPQNDNFNITDNLVAQTLVWSPCGQSVNLRVNSSMMAQSNARMEQTMGIVDSADVSSGLIYHLQFRRCR
ncbi:MAG: DUF4360 domain-containing protein [Bdellovibrio sp.]